MTAVTVQAPRYRCIVCHAEWDAREGDSTEYWSTEADGWVEGECLKAGRWPDGVLFGVCEHPPDQIRTAVVLRGDA